MFDLLYLMLSLSSLGSHHEIGLLLKTSTVGEDERGAMGVVMLWLLACVFASALCTVVLESFSARKWIGIVSHAFKIHYVGKVQVSRLQV
jgi:hypothetical protein